MSYNLIVFEPSAAPTTKAEFEAWVDTQTEWIEGRSYDNPAVLSPALRAWFDDICAFYHPLNEPYSLTPKEFERLGGKNEVVLADYNFRHESIYVGLSWQVADEGDSIVKELARKHHIGFYNPSFRGEVFFPDKPSRHFKLSTSSGDAKDSSFEALLVVLLELEEHENEFVSLEEISPKGGLLCLQAMHQPEKEDSEGFYQVEAQPTKLDNPDMPRFSYKASSIGKVTGIFKDWFFWDESPDFSTWNNLETYSASTQKGPLIWINKQTSKGKFVISFAILAFLIALAAAWIWFDLL